MAMAHGPAQPPGPWPGIAVALAAALALHLGAWAGWAALARPPAAALPPRPGVLALRVVVVPAPPRPAAPVRRAGPARGLASVAAPVAQQGPADDPVGASASPYLPARLLDRPAFPKSAPDLSLLDGLSVSGLPIRLRLYIEATGEVSAAELLAAGPDDAEAVQRIREMFLATAFVPGLKLGREVASVKDVELRLGQ